MNQLQLTTRLQQFQRTSDGRLPPNNGVLLHLEDFRKLILDMAESRKMAAKRFMAPNGQPKRLYFQIGKEKIQVKAVLAGLPLGTLAIELQ